MTESPRHARMVSRLKRLAEEIGCKILENDSGPWGIGGFRFPRQETGKGFISWIADVYIDYKAHRLILECDWKKGHSSHTATIVQNYRRDFLLYYYGIVTVRYDIGDIKNLTAENVQEDIEYFLKESQKLDKFVRMETMMA